jgi:uridylate kinase
VRDADEDGPTSSPPLRYRRILLKLSGEALVGDAGMGIHPAVLDRIVGEIAELHALGVRVGLVVGGGNIYRGAQLAASGLVGRVTGDHLGMLATIMNALCFRDAFEARECPAEVFSGLAVDRVAQPYAQKHAREAFEAGRVLLLAGGTGNPFFTTDTAAALRAAELGVDVLCKATKVDGLFDADPEHNPEAQRIDEIGYREVIERRLRVMDLTAVSLCMDNGIPLAIFNMLTPGNILKLVRGERVGSLVKE